MWHQVSGASWQTPISLCPYCFSLRICVLCIPSVALLTQVAPASGRPVTPACPVLIPFPDSALGDLSVSLSMTFGAPKCRLPGALLLRWGPHRLPCEGPAQHRVVGPCRPWLPLPGDRIYGVHGWGRVPAESEGTVVEGTVVEPREFSQGDTERQARASYDARERCQPTVECSAHVCVFVRHGPRLVKPSAQEGPSTRI